MTSPRLVLALIAAGWIAEVLAATDGDIDAGIEAYEAGEFEEALERFEAAQERRGERPEIHFNRGLALQASGDTEAAREAYERGTESDDDQVRASSHYQLGNLAFDGEQWDAAIEAYKACLRAIPGHENAKWNLELALARKQQQEEEQEKEEQEQEEQNEDGEENEDGEQQEQEQNEEGEEEEQEQQQEGDEQQQEQEQPQEGEQEPEQEQEQEPQEQAQPEPQEIDQADIDAALEQLDSDDQFMLGRPSGRAAEVEKDW